jgi:GH15 family glucan-1,4-alpha-glucosidase
MDERQGGYQPIEGYAVIGDLRTVAMVAIDGSIDFFCAPDFDSPSLFAALLDAGRGGAFRIAPHLTGVRHRQLYLPDTNVLLTRSLADEGVAEICDFMPIIPMRERAAGWAIVRRVKTIRGRIRYTVECAPRFDYARAEHTVERQGSDLLFASRGDGGAARLHASVPLVIHGADGRAVFELGADESAVFVLEEVRPGVPPRAHAPRFAGDAFKETVNFWRRWIARSRYQGRWREAVFRSALTLKLLTSQAHGSMVAAPTFGLPEALGGDRNWDYRYTWIRDSAFTVYALIRLGYTDEAAAFMRWVEARSCAADGELQIVYGLDGRCGLPEETLTHLAGYRGSVPVRIGNDAHAQLQLDIYGELFDAVYLYDKYGAPISYDLWAQLRRFTAWLCAHWRQPDEGIWEMRTGRREFLYSRVMCWVAIDRAIRLAQKRSFPAPLADWVRTRDEIYQHIFAELWDPRRGVFVQSRGSQALDAAALLMPLVRFIGPTDPRWLSTLRAIATELSADSLVHRYEGAAGVDGLKGREGTFNMCSFWYVECLSRAGDLPQARLYFEKLLGYANHVGLYAEELGPRGEHLGNFPQAFTHLALISAAYDLDRRLTMRRERG